MGFGGFLWVLVGFVGFYRVLVGFIGFIWFYPVLSGFIGLYAAIFLFFVSSTPGARRPVTNYVRKVAFS